MSEYSTVASMLGGGVLEDTATSSVCSNEVYPEMNLPSDERTALQKGPKYVKGFGVIFDSSPQIGTDNNGAMKDNLSNKANEDMIGIELHKVFDGVIYKGVATAYDNQTKIFKIEYEDDECENMTREELLQQLAHPTDQPCDKSTVPRPGEKKKYVALKMTASNRSIRNPTMRKKPRSAKKTEEYVPLAVRERRRDDYYWF